MTERIIPDLTRKLEEKGYQFTIYEDGRQERQPIIFPYLFKVSDFQDDISNGSARSTIAVRMVSAPDPRTTLFGHERTEDDNNALVMCYGVQKGDWFTYQPAPEGVVRPDEFLSRIPNQGFVSIHSAISPTLVDLDKPSLVYLVNDGENRISKVGSRYYKEGHVCRTDIENLRGLVGVNKGMDLSEAIDKLATFYSSLRT